VPGQPWQGGGADEPLPGGRHPLAKGASPQAIAAALLPADRSEFLIEYAAALDAAASTWT
jgi:uncharacterized protein DUF6247